MNKKIFIKLLVVTILVVSMLAVSVFPAFAASKTATGKTSQGYSVSSIAKYDGRLLEGSGKVTNGPPVSIDVKSYGYGTYNGNFKQIMYATEKSSNQTHVEVYYFGSGPILEGSKCVSTFNSATPVTARVGRTL